MNIELEEHLSQVSACLDDNIVAYNTPAEVTLSEIRMNWPDMSVFFALAFDGKTLPERFQFSLDGTGWLRFSMPMVTSPSGTPASYPGVEFTCETKAAIEEALHILMPKFAGYGLHPFTSKLIQQSTPVAERVISPVEFERAKAMLLAGNYSVTVQPRHS